MGGWVGGWVVCKPILVFSFEINRTITSVFSTLKMRILFVDGGLDRTMSGLTDRTCI